MRPDEFTFLLAGALVVVAISLLQMLSIWIEKERMLRILIWGAVLGVTVGLVYGIYPEPETLRFGDFANAVIEIVGWLLPP